MKPLLILFSIAFLATSAFAQVTVAVTSPNGGEEFVDGTQETITWTAEPSEDIILNTITYSIDNGVNFSAVGNTENDDFDILWNIPWGVDSETCLIRVHSTTGALSDTDESDAWFTIEEIVVTVAITFPNGGEDFVEGTIVTNAGDTLLLQIEDVEEIKKINNENQPVKINQQIYSKNRKESVKEEKKIVTSEPTLKKKQNDIVFCFGFGVGIPTNPDEFTDYWKPGFCGEGFIGWNSGITKLGIKAKYHIFNINEEELFRDAGISRNSGIYMEGGDVNALSLLFVTKFEMKPNSLSTGYLDLGLGYFHLSVTDATISDSYNSEKIEFTSEDAFIIQLGLGLRIATSEDIALYIEPAYNLAFTEDEKTGYINIIGGIMF